MSWSRVHFIDASSETIENHVKTVYMLNLIERTRTVCYN